MADSNSAKRHSISLFLVSKAADASNEVLLEYFTRQGIRKPRELEGPCSTMPEDKKELASK